MHEDTSGEIYYRAGNWPLDPGKQTIIFIHGSGNSSALWNGQVEALGGQVNTVALDLPGHGKSGGAGMHSVGDYAAVVENFIGRLGGESIIPCGLSLGGAVAIQILLDKKIKTGPAILVNTGARLRVHPAIFELLINDFASYIESLPGSAAAEKTPGSVLKSVVEAARKCGPGVTHGDFTACDSFDAMGRLGEITVPVLVFSAEEDRLTPPKYGRYLKEQLPRAVLEHIVDAGHLSPVEKPEEFNAGVINFLEKVKRNEI